MKRVRIFIDHQNFTLGWKRMIGSGGDSIRWDRLPKLVIRELERKQFVEAGSADLRGVTVYASIDPRKGCGEHTEHYFLKYKLDQLPSYTVRISERQERQCEHDPTVIHTVEKGVDTKIVCDLLALAMRDHYDLAVIISDDSDLVPSVQCVQDIMDRQIVHLGFKDSRCRDMRSAAWGHIMLDSIANELRPARQAPPPAASPAPVGEEFVDALNEALGGGGRKRRRRRKRPASEMGVGSTSAQPATA